MTFLLAEDAGLRNLLQGMTVSDQKSTGVNTPRDVQVWFGMPDSEIRTQNYPYITIEMIDISRDPIREMRGKVVYSEAPYIFDGAPADIKDKELDLPIPVNIDYQVTTYARNPRHDRELIAQLMYSRLPMRFGTLETDDNTVRRLDVLDMSKRDLVESGKRLFMNAFTIRVSSEVTQTLYKEVYKVLSVHVDPLSEDSAGGRPGAPNYTAPATFTISAPSGTP